MHSHKLQAMIDSGATGNFISRELVIELGIQTRKKATPYQLAVVSGDTIAEDGG